MNGASATSDLEAPPPAYPTSADAAPVAAASNVEGPDLAATAYEGGLGVPVQTAAPGGNPVPAASSSDVPEGGPHTTATAAYHGGASTLVAAVSDVSGANYLAIPPSYPGETTHMHIAGFVIIYPLECMECDLTMTLIVLVTVYEKLT